MKIWHIDTIGAPVSVDGVATGLWLLAAEQSLAGANVTMFLRTPPDERAAKMVEKSGVRMIELSRSVRRLLSSSPYRELRQRPDLVHFHSGWVPFHPAFAYVLRRRRIPYVLTPHGAYSPVIRSSKPVARWVYIKAVEAPYAAGAAGVIYNLASEAPQFHGLVGRYGGLERSITFPIDTSIEVAPRRPGAVPTVVYLGRFDPFQKGLDRLVDMAERLPDIRFELYGKEPEKPSTSLAALVARAPANVSFNPPIFGAGKADRLASATLYLQPSRFEGFPLAVADAMLHGLPCAVSPELALAEALRDNDIGKVLSPAPERAAEEIRDLIGDDRQLAVWSARAAGYVRERFGAERSAAEHLDFYRAVLSRSKPSR